MADRAKADKTDLNAAGRDELVAIPGIGEAGADAILKYRKEHGRFASVDDLVHVPGIGDATLQTVRGHLAVSAGTAGKGADDAARQSSAAATTTARRAAEGPAEAAKKAGEAGAEVVRLAADDAKSAQAAGAATAREATAATQRTAERAAGVGEALVRRTEDAAAREAAALTDLARDGTEDMAAAGQAMLGGASEFGQLWMSYWSEQLADGMATARELAECRTWQEALEVQNAFARASFERAWSRMGQSAELATRVFAGGFGPLQRHAAANVARFPRTAA